MKVTRVLETCLYADDLEVGERFYANVLGLEPFSKMHNRHVFFRCGAQQVFLLFNPSVTGNATLPADVPAHGARGPGHVAFAMEPALVPGWRRRLEEFQIPIEKEITWPSGGFSIYFRDPAGNSVELATPMTWDIE